MRYVLMIVGAAVVAYLITKGMAAFMADRKPTKRKTIK